MNKVYKIKNSFVNMKKVIVFLLVLVLISFVSASFEVGNISHSIDKMYPPNDTIKGWMNISFEDQKANSIFSTNFNDEITLLELIKSNNSLSNYDCTPSDCTPDYTGANSGKTLKEFNLGSDEEKIFGFIITGGTLNNIQDFSFNVTSTATSAFFQQLYIDILNNGQFEWRPHESLNRYKEKDYGCYNSSDIEDQATISSNFEYCGEITIPPSPHLKIGTGITGSGEETFTLSIEGQDGSGDCEATTSSSGDISCIPKKSSGGNFTTAGSEYEVCIMANSDSNYKINYELENACGYSEGGGIARDFEIFVRQGAYDSIGDFILNNTELQDVDSQVDKIEPYIENYLYEKYENDCSNDCIIPIRFFSGMNQDIKISDINIKYAAGGLEKESTKLYNLTTTPGTIDSDFQKLYLDNANFSIDEEFGTHDFTLNFENSTGTFKIFTENISIERIPRILSVSPKTALAAYPTIFTVDVETFDSISNITEYKWDFGDNTSIQTTTQNSVEHTYSEIENYDLTITVTNSEGLSSSKTFTITTETPKEAVNSVLSENLNNLANINQKINSLPSFYQDSIKTSLELSNIENQLSSIQQRNTTAASDQDYVDIMNDLSKISVPSDISESETAQFVPFFSSAENIDLEILKEIGGGDYETGNENSYKNAIVSWSLQNPNVQITYKKYSASYPDYEQGLVRFFEINVNEKTGRQAYLVIPSLENINFQTSIEEQNGYYYAELTEDSEEIIFSTTEDVDFETLPAFVSPSLNSLSVSEGEIEEGFFQKYKWILFSLVIIFIIIAGIVAYLVIGRWYRKKYEDYLFNNKNDLYNIVNYIHNAKKKGVENKEIEKNLRKSKWSSEQINYVMKKYAGKDVGLPGLKKLRQETADEK